ncbi:hypothetical protein PMAYCL1PPCAC_00543, partial [Pristionchus mayeri]
TIFDDPHIDLTTKPVLEQMRQMNLNRLPVQIGDNVEVDGEYEDYFPFLVLPNELISDVLSYLSPKDRLKSRVNKRLNEIEANSKYFVKELNIVEEDKLFWGSSSASFESATQYYSIRKELISASQDSSRAEKSRYSRRLKMGRKFIASSMEISRFPSLVLTFGTVLSFSNCTKLRDLWKKQIGSRDGLESESIHILIKFFLTSFCIMCVVISFSL